MVAKVGVIYANKLFVPAPRGYPARGMPATSCSLCAPQWHLDGRRSMMGTVSVCLYTDTVLCRRCLVSPIRSCLSVLANKDTSRTGLAFLRNSSCRKRAHRKLGIAKLAHIAAGTSCAGVAGSRRQII